MDELPPETQLLEHPLSEKLILKVISLNEAKYYFSKILLIC